MRGRRRFPSRPITLAVLSLTILVAVPAGAVVRERPLIGGPTLSHLSQVVVSRYYAANRDQAPAEVAARVAALRETKAAVTAGRGTGARLAGGILFNRDDLGLPQNEESITVCPTNREIVLGGTNDYRGLIDPEGNFTGWHFSNDGGRSVTNEGLLPPVELITEPREVPSGGDPVDVAHPTCDFLYAASLAYNPVDPFGDKNGIAVYRTTPEILASCDTSANLANPACWPVRRLVAEGGPTADPDVTLFEDKEWMDVGVSGDAGVVVWVVWTEFAIDFSTGGFTAGVLGVRCNEDLSVCTDPIPISGADRDVQFADVTIGPDGRVYVTWSEIRGELPEDPEFPAQTFIHKLRIAPAGSTDFGPTQIIAVEENAIPFGGFLHANDFRVATYLKNEVALVGGEPRIFAVWDACLFRLLDTICEEPEIKLRYSDDDGATWSPELVLSAGGDNYFPAISWNDDPGNPQLALAWFTNRFDEIFHNTQDIDYLVLDAAKPKPHRPSRMTGRSNESEADPLLGGVFIGDYIETAANGNRVWIHFNGNYRRVPLLGVLGFEGVPVPQQDNYLIRTNTGAG